MTTTGDLYAVLGVSSNADEVVIRAAFKALMLRYHPDTNRSEDATKRAAAINAAYAILGDPKKRAAYDEAQRNFAGRTGGGSPPPPPAPPKTTPKPPPAPLNPMSSGSKTLLTWLLFIIVVGGVRVLTTAHSSASDVDNTLVADLNTTDDMAVMDDNMMAADGVQTAPEVPTRGEALGLMANDMAPEASATSQTLSALNFQNIEGAAKSFDRVLARRGMAGARAASEACHAKLKAQLSWPAADNCVGFDLAARFVDQTVAREMKNSENQYFKFAADNAADSYSGLNSSYLAGERVSRIREAIGPTVGQIIQARLARQEPAARQDLMGLVAI